MYELQKRSEKEMGRLTNFSDPCCAAVGPKSNIFLVGIHPSRPTYLTATARHCQRRAISCYGKLNLDSQILVFFSKEDISVRNFGQ